MQRYHGIQEEELWYPMDFPTQLCSDNLNWPSKVEKFLNNDKVFYTKLRGFCVECMIELAPTNNGLYERSTLVCSELQKARCRGFDWLVEMLKLLTKDLAFK